MVVVANHLMRLKHDGVFVLRIDDTDDSRLVDGAEERIRADLAWLGVTVDEGPDDGPYGPYRQSLRADQHRAVAEQMVDDGHARRESDGAIVLPPAAEDVVVPDLSRGPVRIPAEDLGATVLIRSDGRPTYHLASAADDHALGITHVLRGEDHLVNTARHLLVLAAMDVAPPAYAHLPIVVGGDGGKLSGRNGALGIGALQDAGWLPAAVVDWLARSACPATTALPAASAAELAVAFDPARLGHGTTRLDPALLATLGRDHMARIGHADLVVQVGEAITRRGDVIAPRVLEVLAPGLGEATNLQAAVDLILGVVMQPALPPVGDGERAAAGALIAARSGLGDVIDLAAAEQLLGSLGVGKRAVRRVLTGAEHGIPLPFVLAALTCDEVLSRARAVLDLP